MTMKSIMVDTHTHTVLSGHAWSTLRENARAAKERGLPGMCLTEHGHALPGAGPFFLTPAQKMLPPEVEGVRIFYGVEANILDYNGKLDIEDRMLFGSEWNIASMHDICVTPGTVEENTNAFIRALEHPAIDMLGHIDDKRTANDFSRVVAKAGELGKPIEINNNSMLVRRSRDRIVEIARECKKQGVTVAVSSDAHFDTMVGSVTPALELLDEVGFPDELVVNRSMEAFEAYLSVRNRRLEEARPGFLANRRSARRMAQQQQAEAGK